MIGHLFFIRPFDLFCLFLIGSFRMSILSVIFLTILVLVLTPITCFLVILVCCLTHHAHILMVLVPHRGTRNNFILVMIGYNLLSSRCRHGNVGHCVVLFGCLLGCMGVVMSQKRGANEGIFAKAKWSPSMAMAIVGQMT